MVRMGKNSSPRLSLCSNLIYNFLFLLLFFVVVVFVVLKSVQYKFLDLHRLKLIVCNFLVFSNCKDVNEVTIAPH